ncbi:TetR/AcrR family transcriptional regulator [Actinoplanes sp. Pm04-4]|uniref:TetR/AcrR family transcriptional regulator n=1 Tax=Paractinoplanes pyxinae TaxID=2997416 RepID=A0ABT4BAX8_9ACTN|nr:TetR/AcrR family transcriptional regulator [Actinoplanes pyxinae]MCY1143676.1 TetR/AcrR family transcriptional regulator [Actinoplanes pyxinae]
MADIISESGLSAGAVYRYFRSKDDLISAVAGTALTSADEAFGALLADGATPSPEQAMAAMLHVIGDQMANHPALGVDVTRVGVQVWAEALRSPQLAARADDVYRRLRDYFAEVARRWQATGQLDARAVPEQVGAAMLGVMQGFIVQRLLINGTDTDDYLAGVKALLAARP